MNQSKAGLIGLATGVLGAASAGVLLLWPSQAPADVLSHPFTTEGFLVAQGWFAVHHLGLVVLLVALARSGAVGHGRVMRFGAWLAVAAMVGLSLTELLAMRYAEWDADAANQGLMGTAYGITVTAIGIGMLTAGVGVLRAGSWTSWHRWAPLAVGLAVFIVVTPGMFGGFVVGRLAIGFWMLLLAALGYGMYVESRRAALLASAARPGTRTTAGA